MYGEDGRPLTELEILKMKMNKTTDESVESTRRMVQLADESQRVGAATMDQLANQGDQLKNVDQQMDEMHADLKHAQHNLEQLDKCCGLCVLPWNKSKRVKEDSAFKKPHRTISSVLGGSNSATTTKQPNNLPVLNQSGIPGQNQYVTRITNDAREDEMDTNLNQVGLMVGDLKNMATSMNAEIVSHNDLLERIDRKTDANQIRLNDAQLRANAIVGKPATTTDNTSTLPTSTSIGLAAAKYMAK